MVMPWLLKLLLFSKTMPDGHHLFFVGVLRRQGRRAWGSKALNVQQFCWLPVEGQIIEAFFPLREQEMILKFTFSGMSLWRVMIETKWRPRISDTFLEVICENLCQGPSFWYRFYLCGLLFGDMVCSVLCPTNYYFLPGFKCCCFSSKCWSFWVTQVYILTFCTQ